ncbi:CDP-diacylglycerol--glycerol-3-phosphate 3-phosphatidyltransferase [Olsenella sp. AM30-3LB]|jgi:CDP-diacylglycerol--glycerol-3-phosphate 3-phosphatidyltransferase|uniref:CDP-diacylglycerol--glycerol-3-phosphate 3-phosphatidyltransferase n=1 Tax=unclassified Olsenella TaxID=2638792 RepID=UPI000509A34A|nr:MULTISPECIES: CDP-diacylglycerol--glycerol-3-phosphate 3-phosphatidyltransferase [unclassified Olsenella]RHD75450.1 CDP-diacylglycerol--glycerol-3-phosphate 3-phosphatidyltransferase [Olsenella sp. AM30-3LB]RHJ96030.1 CDP-diacylglycerol--glycerol-3-phosphate 3-phosphatidyltransferase [Olsenella sp. AM05-7]RHK00536.1 CDP-diacylglycerol--glycerol-3-phosphate 3-phosphatidyltransferase [Olsenella sp. AM05-17]
MSPAASKGGGGTTSSIWTPANVVTCVRVVAVPLWLLVAEFSPAAGTGSAWSLGVFLFFVVLSLTDKLDGYLARSRNEVTTFGKFLDPIADKLVVVVALCFLLERGEASSWVLLVIVAREFLVSGLRMVVASAGTVIAASPLGKGKTAVTMVAISALLLAMALPAGSVSGGFELLGQVLMVVAVVLTAWSGIDYFAKSWSYIVGKR